MSITFIIPYYKLEKYLLMRCINSIRPLGNDFDWEIRIIDDGTPKSNASTWIKNINDKRIHYTYIEHQGLGGARNRGIEEATKEYIQMVDSDDYLFIDQLKNALRIIDKKKPDALTFKYEKVYTISIENTKNTDESKIEYEGNAIDYMANNDIPPSSCRYIIKKSAIDNLRFTPGLLHEDEEFSTFIFLKLKTLVVTNLHVYAYYQRANSIINSTDTEFILKRFDNLRYILKKIEIQKDKFDPASNTHKAFKRKCDVLSLCIIINLINSNLDWTHIAKELGKLKQMKYYPLQAGQYGARYSFIRYATYTPLSVYLVNKANKIIRNFRNTKLR